MRKVNIIPIGEKTEPSMRGPFPIRSGTSVDCEKIKKTFQKIKNNFQNKLRVAARTKAHIGTTTPAAKLEVAGGIKIGTATTCTSTEEGTLRYNSMSKIMEFCDGTGWASMGSTNSIDWY